MSDGDETTVVEPVVAAAAAAAAVGSDESGLTRRKPTEAATTTTADDTATTTKPTKRKKKKTTKTKKLTPEERQARLERLSKAREARHDFLLGNRTRPEVRADRGEAPAPAKFTPLPGTAEAAQAEQAAREREAALAAAAGAGGGLASLGPMFGAATSSGGGGDVGAAGAAAAGGGVAATVARVALLQRLLCAVLGVAVALWPSVDAAGLEAEVTPASRLWLYLIPLFVAIQLMGRRVLHFLGAAVPGAAGALFAVKVAASDFTTTFGAFWIAHMVLKASFDAWYFDPGEPPADHDAGRMGALPPQEL